MKLGIETESYHLFFQQGVMDVFDFINKAAELGLDGVELNIIPDEGLHPEFGVLTSDNPEYLAKIRQAIEDKNLYCELDTRFTTPEALTKAIDIARGIGADVIRTYMFRRGQYNPKQYPKIIQDIKSIVPLLKKYRVRLAIENHEDETADEIVNIIKNIDSTWVGAHCDIGNGMMAWEDPIVTVSKLAPYTYSTHFKDHIVTYHDETPVITGMPLGEGSINIDECFRLLVEHSPVTRINLENCFPYTSHFARDKGTGGVFEFSGSFEVKPPPFDSKLIKPLEYYYPEKISRMALETLMEAQDRCVQVSVNELKKLRKKYCY
ncbi:sugar phosphate isomerase/epimerase family protein [Proteus terrae]|uniref:sugar phosphate isomerase/epimerase family protein n=1 Tax=Proteus terrae TaxID=1574161 RepID=UPI00370B1E99